MKNNIFKIFACSMALVAFASCELNETPVFDDKDAFVAMDKSSIIVNEDAGRIVIPVTIASIDPMKTSVTYKVNDSTAVAGKDFTPIDESAVLVFDGTTRTMNIEIDIIPHVGEYTGDMIFTIDILGGGSSLNLGANASCTIKISDLDHPLAEILGAYTASGFNYFDGADESWTLTMYKDDVDVNVVWIDGFVADIAGAYPAYDYRIYGTVSEEKTSISFPLGQALKDKISGEVFTLWSFDGQYVNNEGSIEAKLVEGVWTIEEGVGIGRETDSGVSLVGLYAPESIKWIKK